MSDRAELRAILLKLAAGFEGFKDREMELWLDAVAHCTEAQVDRVVMKFLTDDPRESESVRSRRPKLADIMRHLPARPDGTGHSGPVKCITWGPFDGYRLHGGMSLDELPNDERKAIAEHIHENLSANRQVRETQVSAIRSLYPPLLDAQPKLEAMA